MKILVNNPASNHSLLSPVEIPEKDFFHSGVLTTSDKFNNKTIHFKGDTVTNKLLIKHSTFEGNYEGFINLQFNVSYKGPFKFEFCLYTCVEDGVWFHVEYDGITNPKIISANAYSNVWCDVNSFVFTKPNLPNDFHIVASLYRIKPVVRDCFHVTFNASKDNPVKSKMDLTNLVFKCNSSPIVTKAIGTPLNKVNPLINDR